MLTSSASYVKQPLEFSDEPGKSVKFLWSHCAGSLPCHPNHHTYLICGICGVPPVSGRGARSIWSIWSYFTHVRDSWSNELEDLLGIPMNLRMYMLNISADAPIPSIRPNTSTYIWGLASTEYRYEYMSLREIDIPMTVPQFFLCCTLSGML